MTRNITLLCTLVFVLTACRTTPDHEALVAGLARVSNPVIDGYFADPSVVIHEGVLYLYATRDPWGGEDLACFSTSGFETWQAHTLNWPTKQACQSEASTTSMVWAPSVIRATNGRFYMYVSVGSEVYCGVADHPLGPWSNVLDSGEPLIASQRDEGVHTIDAEAFIDDDGRAYLYWGSGFNWVNGRCIVVELAQNMHSFVSEPRDITPPGYFEAPFMIKRYGKYFLTYSDGKTIDDTYKVRYAIADHPFGPFESEGTNSPILSTDASRGIYGPGHHCVFTLGGKDYIAYHRHKRPYKPNPMLRQICIDPLNVRDDGAIDRVIPTE